MNVVAIVTAVLAGTLVTAPNRRVRLAIIVTTLVTWTSAALLECFIATTWDDLIPTLVFFFIILPLVIAPGAGVLATVLVGPPRHFFPSVCAAIAGCVAGMVLNQYRPSSPFDLLDECFRQMAAPTILAACAAALVASIANRRV